MCLSRDKRKTSHLFMRLSDTMQRLENMLAHERRHASRPSGNRVPTSFTVTCSVLVAVAAALIWCGTVSAQTTDTPKDQAEYAVYQKLVSFVLQHNPLLVSQARVVEQARNVSAPRSSSGVTGLDFGVSAGQWSNSSNTYGYAPTASFGVTIAIDQPSRALDILRIRQQKEEAQQQLERMRVQVLKDLFDRTSEILRLQAQIANQENLRRHIEVSRNMLAQQSRDSMTVMDRLMTVQEKLSDIEVQLQDAKNKLRSSEMDAAVTLGGADWHELFNLLGLLKQSP